MVEKNECPYLKSCPLFQFFKLEVSKKLYITNYCQGQFDKCERKKLKDIGKTVPDKLLPNGKHLQ
jgi:hypothetical protein